MVCPGGSAVGTRTARGVCRLFSGTGHAGRRQAVAPQPYPGSAKAAGKACLTGPCPLRLHHHDVLPG